MFEVRFLKLSEIFLAQILRKLQIWGKLAVLILKGGVLYYQNIFIVAYLTKVNSSIKLQLWPLCFISNNGGNFAS